jgi:hypothetical protein
MSISWLFTSYANVVSTTGTIQFDVQEDQSHEMVLNSTGLGIGVNSPSANLHVKGNALVNEVLNVGSSTLGSSNLNIHGSMGMSPASVSTNISLGDSSLVLADSSAGNLILLLPNASSSSNVSGQVFNIKKTSTSNNVIIAGAPIDGRDSLTLRAAGTALPSVKLINYNGSYYILSASDNVDYGFASDNLALWWPLDNLSGSQTWDISGSQRHGNIIPNSIVTGKSGNALSLNGNDNYVLVNSDAATNLSGNFSISAWVKRVNSGSMMLLSKKNGWNVDGGYEVELSGGIIRFLGGTVDAWADSNSVTWGSTWQHIAVVCETFSSTTYVHFYHNGSDISSGDNTTNAVSQSSIAMHIGNRTVDNSVDYTGEIDELRIFNKALSAVEVTQLYGLGTSVASANLTVHYSFDAISGNVIALSGGSGQTGTLTPNPGSATGLGSGVLGSGISLDGVDDAVEISSIGISGNTQHRTVMAWVKVSTWTNDAGVWHTGATSGYQDFSVELTGTPGTMTLNLWGGDTDFNLSGGSGDWHHIAAVYNGTSFTVYVNGVSASTAAHVFDSGMPDNGITVGKPRASGAGGSYFHGFVDDVRVYNTALIQSNIQLIYSIGR